MWTYNAERNTNLAKTDKEESAKIKLPTSSYSNAESKMDKRNACRVLVRKPQRSVTLGILRRKQKDNINHQKNNNQPSNTTTNFYTVVKVCTAICDVTIVKNVVEEPKRFICSNLDRSEFWLVFCLGQYIPTSGQKDVETLLRVSL